MSDFRFRVRISRAVTSVAAGYNNSPNARNSSAGSATSFLMSAGGNNCRCHCDVDVHSERASASYQEIVSSVKAR